MSIWYNYICIYTRETHTIIWVLLLVLWAFQTIIFVFILGLYLQLYEYLCIEFLTHVSTYRINKYTITKLLYKVKITTTMFCQESHQSIVLF